MNWRVVLMPFIMPWLAPAVVRSKLLGQSRETFKSSVGVCGRKGWRTLETLTGARRGDHSRVAEHRAGAVGAPATDAPRLSAKTLGGKQHGDKVKQRPLSWRTEGEFERWFMKNPFLPKGVLPNRERVLVISRQRPIRRVVDLLALDGTGGLVIVEVKNERSTRAAIGQSLEYLAQYVGTVVEDLEDEYSALIPTGNLKDDFRSLFNKELSVASRRRVYLVAPSFDIPSAVCVQYLGERLLAGDVEYNLIRATRKGAGFRIERFECPAFTPARNLQTGDFAVTPSGRLYYVLERGPKPVLWNIGKRISVGGFLLLATRALNLRCIQVVNRMLIPAESANEVDVAQSGTVWQHPKKAATTAKLMGRVLPDSIQPGQQGFAVIARFVDKAFEKFQQRSWSDFAADWRKVDIELPDWRSIATAARNRAPH
jgi:hypothetical protein